MKLTAQQLHQHTIAARVPTLWWSTNWTLCAVEFGLLQCHKPQEDVCAIVLATSEHLICVTLLLEMHQTEQLYHTRNQQQRWHPMTAVVFRTGTRETRCRINYIQISWQFFASSSKEYLVLHVNHPLFLANCDYIWIFFTDFHKSSPFQISWKSPLGAVQVLADRWTWQCEQSDNFSLKGSISVAV